MNDTPATPPSSGGILQSMDYSGLNLDFGYALSIRNEDLYTSVYVSSPCKKESPIK